MATQTPVDMAAMFALSRAGTISAGRVAVQAAPGWREGTNLFIAVAMEPGRRESAVQRDMCAPIRAFEEEASRRLGPVIAEAASRRRIAQAALANAEGAAAHAKAETRAGLEAIAAAEAQALEELDVPAAARLYTADATPEALVTLARREPGPDGHPVGGGRHLLPDGRPLLEWHSDRAVRVLRAVARDQGPITDDAHGREGKPDPRRRLDRLGEHEAQLPQSCLDAHGDPPL